MAVTLTLADDTFEKTWDGCVVSSPHGTIFHTWQWLRLIEKQSSTKLLPILIYKGTVLIALYPVFLQKRYFYTLALSPPFGAYMVYLGPVIIDYESSKQDNKENLFIQIQQEVDKFIAAIIAVASCLTVNEYQEELLRRKRTGQKMTSPQL